MNTKISDHQLFSLAAICTIGTTLLSVASGTAALANRDAWISAIISPVIGLGFIWTYYYLGKLYPGKTLIEIFNSAFGKWLGWIISAYFVIFVCCLDAAQLMFYTGDFAQMEYMTETPIFAFRLLLTLAIGIGMLYGLEAIARSTEVFVITITVLIGLAILMSLPNIKPENLLPVLEKGIAPPLKGALYLSSYMTWPFVILLMIYPASTNHTKKTRNALFLGYIFGSVMSFVCTIMSIMVLGSKITAQSQFPIYLLAKEINLGIINRIEGITALSWLLSSFTKTLLYFYAGTIGFCQLFKIKDYRKIVFPLGLVILVFSGVVYPDAAYEAKWDTTTWIPFIGTFGAILPIIIIVITKIKKKMDLLISTQDQME